ncbi:MAG: family transcriptional regulator [Paenibacillaceae bacterium]|nr:family transcriptional regulator [Paenibacillaceae bacterium]
MSDTGHLQNLALNICSLRKQQGLTQEALADRLGLTFQAVSKWENFQSSPDIQLLPRLAEIFQVSVDRLFGIEKLVPAVKGQELAVGTGLGAVLPWADDGTLRVVLYKGRTLLQSEDAEEPKMVFRYEGPALNVESRISVECGDVEGRVQANRDIYCQNVDGGASAGRDLSCFDVQGGANAGRDVQCCNVGAEVSAGQDVRCNDVSGDAVAGRNLSCGDVGGNINAMGRVECATVGGGITTLGPVSYTGPGGETAAGGGIIGEPAKARGETGEGTGGAVKGKGYASLSDKLHQRIIQGIAGEDE